MEYSIAFTRALTLLPELLQNNPPVDEALVLIEQLRRELNALKIKKDKLFDDTCVVRVKQNLDSYGYSIEYSFSTNIELNEKIWLYETLLDALVGICKN